MDQCNPPPCHCHRQASHDGPECLFERLLQPDRTEIPPANTNDSLDASGMKDHHSDCIHVLKFVADILKDPAAAASLHFGSFNEFPQFHISQLLMPAWCEM